MNQRVRRLILITVAAAVVSIAAAYFLFPVQPALGGLPGLVFWTLAALAASALPVKLPRGSVVSVAAAPLLAVLFLGGPFAAAVVSLIGTTDSRELRGEVPWYGTLYNHAAAVISIMIGAVAYEAYRALEPADPAIALPLSFLAALIASALYFLASAGLAIGAVAVRTGQSFRAVWTQDVGGIGANLIGLAPLAWLMAQIFQLPNYVGWWATVLFVVPLFTTRLAYARYVETRELFEQTIEALAKAVDARDKYTRNHSSRVSHIAEAMCRVMRLPESEIEKIKWAGLLHDVGKIGIPDAVLLKLGKLTLEEFELVKTHTTIGARILSGLSLIHI